MSILKQRNNNILSHIRFILPDYVLIMIILLIPMVAFSGKYGDAFMQIGTTPRAISLGQANVAVSRFGGGYLTNPAAIGNINRLSVYLMAVDQFSLANYYSAGLVKPLSKKWFYAINLLSLQISNIPIHPDLRLINSIEARRDTIRQLSSNGFDLFDDNESAFILTFTRSPEINVDLGWAFTPFSINMPLGINIKTLRKHFYNLEGYGLGADIGSMIRFDLKDLFAYDWMGEMTLGAAYRDIFGTIIYWNSKHQDRIPPAIVKGISYKQPFQYLPVNILLTYQSSSRFKNEYRLGAEISISDRVYIRMGNDHSQQQGGIGIVLPVLGKKLSIDYSFTSHVLGDSHRIGGSVVF